MRPDRNDRVASREQVTDEIELPNARATAKQSGFSTYLMWWGTLKELSGDRCCRRSAKGLLLALTET